MDLSKDSEIASEASQRCRRFLSEPNASSSLNADIRAAVFDVAVQAEGSLSLTEYKYNRIYDNYNRIYDIIHHNYNIKMHI